MSTNEEKTMSEAKVVKCWMFTYPATTVVGVDDDERNAAENADGLSPLTPAVAVPLEDYMEVRSTMLGTASYHMKDTETPYCRVCGASDGRWPCSARIDADAVLALLPEVPHV